MAIVKLCTYPNCNEFTVPHSIYCNKHKEKSDKKRIAFRNAKRSNEAFYKTSEWRKLRKEHLKENNYCVWCGCNNDLSVDHITPPKGNPDLFFNENNLQTLCRACHRIKTAREIELNKYKEK